MLLQKTSGNVPTERFVAELRSVCGQFDVRTGSANHKAWGGVAIRDDIALGMVATNMQQILRTPQHVRRDQGENYFLVMQKEGRALMAQNETTTLLLPGDFVIIDSASPSEFTFFGDRSRQITMNLPRTEVHERFGSEIPCGLSMSRADPTAKALSATFEKILHSKLGALQTKFLREAVFGLLGAFLFDQSRGLPDRRPADIDLGSPLLERALDIIEAGFRDSSLTSRNIAISLGVHSRQIQRAFEPLGVTPTKLILTKRLENARAKLESRLTEQGDELISSIAYESGFSDLSYFNRKFRQAFDCTPGAYGLSNS